MKYINLLITTILSLLLGTNTSAKHSLYKEPTRDDFRKEFNYWYARNFNFIALAVLAIVFVAFILFCFIICGVSATESGMMRNFINGGVI